ncbi:hypothetical protein M405DRAFT_841462 [Rhizopogon salebrosus TDB-379]|nr:hypothetical protein M405DRAFT_841462 [Rhizopogon salebrosus TDB-379]
MHLHYESRIVSLSANLRALRPGQTIPSFAPSNPTFLYPVDVISMKLENTSHHSKKIVHVGAGMCMLESAVFLNFIYMSENVNAEIASSNQALGRCPPDDAWKTGTAVQFSTDEFKLRDPVACWHDWGEKLTVLGPGRGSPGSSGFVAHPKY